MTSKPAARKRAKAACTAATESTRKAKWFTHRGVLGEGSLAVLSPRSKNATELPSVISKNKCTYGQCSPVLGMVSARTMCVRGKPSKSS